MGAYYEEHHATGNRLRQSFMEDVRGELFCSWIGKGKTVLDLGGRDGSLTRHLLDGNRVVIEDIDIAALAYARGNYTVDTVQINLNEPLPFVSESCDVVVMAEVLEHLPYPKITLSEVERVLHKGGGSLAASPSPTISRIAGRCCVERNYGWQGILPTFSFSNMTNSLQHSQASSAFKKYGFSKAEIRRSDGPGYSQEILHFAASRNDLQI